MSEFTFKPAKNTYLEHTSKGYFLVSKTPVRLLRINESLYTVLQDIQAGRSLSEIIRNNPALRKEQLLQILLSLTYKGYYQLDGITQLEEYPLVSVIVPAYSPSQNLLECLNSLAGLDYPQDKLEVIVVEDGPSNNTPDLSVFKITHIKLEESRGPGAARNAGAIQARGEILAFLDSDCIADKNWLNEIVPFFQLGFIGAVGGLVAGYHKRSLLDRYEEVSSSLNLGQRILFEGNTESVLYVPTCNMLVKREVFNSINGFKVDIRVGEDVDFCWRLRKSGQMLLYTPVGKVYHKHRSQFWKMLLRRSDYGSSEAPLYRSDKEKRKSFIIPVWACLSFVALIVAILLKNPYPLCFILILLGVNFFRESIALKRFNIVLPVKQIGFSTLRSHFSFYYFASFHIIRYYLFILLIAGFFYHPIWYFCIFSLLLTSIVDFILKKPRLVYPLYLLFYVSEHLAYQLGVFLGCLKTKYFGSYRLKFSFNTV
jgi:mycofactocin glycosyltransferase